MCQHASDLTDPEWVIIAPYVPAAKSGGRPRTINIRKVVKAIFYSYEPVVPGGCCRWEGYRDTVLLYYAAFPDLEVWNDDVFASGDRLAIRWTAAGTHDGELLGIHASGQSGHHYRH